MTVVPDSDSGNGCLAPQRPEAMARVFFALWPDAATRAALARLAQDMRDQCGGRAMSAGNLHLTLVFLGNVAGGRLPELCSLAQRIVAPAFDLVIDTVGYWRHNRIVVTSPAQYPTALQTLVAELESALTAAGFDFDKRPYVPHITLVRNAHRAPLARIHDGISWSVADFALVQSLRRDRGTVYEAMRSWPLDAKGR
ncbi:MAG: RNA 2',3'-cyclic phosphodiesterase [Burkholderiales bacterium]